MTLGNQGPLQVGYEHQGDDLVPYSRVHPRGTFP